MKQDSKIYVAGHRGLVGSSLLRRLKREGYNNIVTRTHSQLDLRSPAATRRFFEKEKPEFVYLLAAKVGGIMANNTQSADFIYDNLMIETSVIKAAQISGVRKLLFLGSNAVYPKMSPQPIKEEYLLTGPLEETNEPYSIAKIAGIKMCQAFNKQYGTNFISVMSANLYGPDDHFGLNNSHVIPALIRKFHEAEISNSKTVEVWGTGRARRGFLYSDDLAEALVFLMNHYNSSEIINVGSGKDLTIKELAYLIKDVVGFRGKIVFDKTKPDGAPQKVFDVSKINKLGWRAKTELKDGIKKEYDYFVKNIRILLPVCFVGLVGISTIVLHIG